MSDDQHKGNVVYESDGERPNKQSVISNERNSKQLEQFNHQQQHPHQPEHSQQPTEATEHNHQAENATHQELAHQHPHPQLHQHGQHHQQNHQHPPANQQAVKLNDVEPHHKVEHQNNGNGQHEVQGHKVEEVLVSNPLEQQIPSNIQPSNGQIVANQNKEQPERPAEVHNQPQQHHTQHNVEVNQHNIPSEISEQKNQPKVQNHQTQKTQQNHHQEHQVADQKHEVPHHQVSQVRQPENDAIYHLQRANQHERLKQEEAQPVLNDQQEEVFQLPEKVQHNGNPPAELESSSQNLAQQPPAIADAPAQESQVNVAAEQQPAVEPKKEQVRGPSQSRELVGELSRSSIVPPEAQKKVGKAPQPCTCQIM